MKILAVDDDAVALELLGACLSQGGYQNHELTASPLDALRILRDKARDFDCILLDISMPKKDGIELCADIRKLDRYRHTPILMITKHAEQEKVELAFAKGATDYITKPIDPFEVTTRIRLAERLVRERQAAVDSYVALQNAALDSSLSATIKQTKTSGQTLIDADLHVPGNKILPLNVFSNFLAQRAEASDFSMNLVAVKLRNVDLIFLAVSAEEFLSILKTTAEGLIELHKPESVFATHAGNGIFLFAVDTFGRFEPAELESRLRDRLKEVEVRMPSLGNQPLEVVAGTPLVLSTTPKLNFNRARKAAIARADKYEAECLIRARVQLATQTA